MQYQDIPEFNILEINQALNSNSITKVSEAILSLSLYFEDFKIAQDIILKYANGSNLDLKFIALQAIGHLGRRYHDIDQSKVIPILREALKSEDSDIRGVAEDTIDELEYAIKDFSIE